MTQFKKYNKEFFLYIQSNIYLVILYLAALSFGTIISMYLAKSLSSAVDIPVSIGDYFLYSSYGLDFYLNRMLFPCLLFSFMIKDDVRINVLIRYQKIRKMVFREFYFSIVIILFTIIFEVILIFIIGINSTDIWINFDSFESLFALHNRGMIMNSCSLLLVLVVTFSYNFLMGLFFSCLYLLLKWFFFNNFIPFLLLLFVGALDVFAGIGMCNFFGVYYNKWFSFHLSSFIVPIFLGIVFYLLLNICLARRDFLHAK